MTIILIWHLKKNVVFLTRRNFLNWKMLINIFFHFVDFSNLVDVIWNKSNVHTEFIINDHCCDSSKDYQNALVLSLIQSEILYICGNRKTTSISSSSSQRFDVNHFDLFQSFRNGIVSIHAKNDQNKFLVSKPFQF